MWTRRVDKACAYASIYPLELLWISRRDHSPSAHIDAFNLAVQASFVVILFAEKLHGCACGDCERNECAHASSPHKLLEIQAATLYPPHPHPPSTHLTKRICYFYHHSNKHAHMCTHTNTHTHTHTHTNLGLLQKLDHLLARKVLGRLLAIELQLCWQLRTEEPEATYKKKWRPRECNVDTMS